MCFFLYQKENVFVGYAHHFLGWIQIRKKILKYPMTWQLIFQAFIFFLRQKKQWSNSFKCFYLQWTDDPVEQNWLKCLGCSRSRLTNSAQQVPEPDQLSGISFDTRPNLIQFWKSSGSPKHRDSQTPMFPNTKLFSEVCLKIYGLIKKYLKPLFRVEEVGSLSTRAKMAPKLSSRAYLIFWWQMRRFRAQLQNYKFNSV